jgi:hypothetical protein
LVATQREARDEWSIQAKRRRILDRRPDQIVALARRYYQTWRGTQDEHPYSLWGQAYHNLIKPLAPWYVRWPLILAVGIDTLRWRRQQQSWD